MKYNFVFSGMTMFNGLPARSEAEFWNFISQIKYGRTTLTDEERTECSNLQTMIKEVFCLTNIIKTKLETNTPVTLQDYFNLLDKYDFIFDSLFSTHVTNVHRIRLLRDYTNMWNAITHAHVILIGNEVKFVHWDWYGQPRRVLSTLDHIDHNELLNELKYLAIMVSQIVAIYQLVHQTYHR